MTSLATVPEHKSTRARTGHTRRPSSAQTNARLNARPSTQARVGNYNLVLAGKGKAALAFHLGVCIRLSETGLLSKFDIIFAEDFGVILAALLRCHWRTIYADSAPVGYKENSKSYRYLLATPPSPLFETSQEHKDVLHAMRAGAASIVPDDKVVTVSAAVTKEVKENSAAATVLTTISSPHQTVENSKSLFTQKITEPMMDLILNVDLAEPSDAFIEWMTRCSLSLDAFSEDDKNDEFQRRCSVRLLKQAGPKPFSMQQCHPGCFDRNQDQMMMTVLPAILWGKPFTSNKLPRFSSIWHAMLMYGVSVQRNFRQQTTFITSLADIPRGPMKAVYQEPVPLHSVTSVSKETHTLMQNLLNAHLTTSADCECGTDDVTKHVHCLIDLLRHDFIQSRFLVVETLQGCPITGSKLSTTVSPDNRLVVSPVRTPAVPEQTASPDSERVISLRPSISSTSSSNGSTSKLTAPTEQSEWPQAVLLRIEGALLQRAVGSAMVSHALVGSCLNWGYKQSVAYIHKMLQHSPKLSSLNLTDRKPVLPISLQSSIRMLTRHSSTGQQLSTGLSQLSAKHVCKCLCCCACGDD